MSSENPSADIKPGPAGSRLTFPNRNDLPSLDDPKTQHVFQAVINNRKNWKTVKGGEIVWPPELEAALIEGLERYEPVDSRETRILGRYPLRNRFISEHIFQKTGVKRTAKQVGSRLQQLRDTATEDKLLKLLLPCTSMKNSWRARTPSDGASSSDTTDSPVTPVDRKLPDFNGLIEREHPRSIIIVDVLSNSTSKRPISTLSDDENDNDFRGDIFRPTTHPRPFRSIDPKVAFTGPPNLCAESSFSVYLRGVFVFRETTALTCLGPVPDRSPDDDIFLYSTTLVPGFWDRISECSDPSQYFIFQDVIKACPPGSSSSSSSSSTTVFSAVYKFRCHSQSKFTQDMTSPSPSPSCTTTTSRRPVPPPLKCFDDDIDINAIFNTAPESPTHASLNSLMALSSLSTSDFGDIHLPSTPGSTTTTTTTVKCESPDPDIQWYDFLNLDPQLLDTAVSLSSPGTGPPSPESPFLVDYSMYYYENDFYDHSHLEPFPDEDLISTLTPICHSPATPNASSHNSIQYMT